MFRATTLLLLSCVLPLTLVSPSLACLQCRCRFNQPDGSPGAWGAWYPSVNAVTCAQSCVAPGGCFPFPCPPAQLGQSQTGQALPANACGIFRPPPPDRCRMHGTGNAC